jgi:hypothetical protein
MSRRRVDLEGVGLGAAVGVVLPALGYLLLMAMRVQVTDAVLVALLVVPVVFCASLLALPPTRPRAPGLLIGVLVGEAVMVGVLLGGISLVAWMLSD